MRGSVRSVAERKLPPASLTKDDAFTIETANVLWHTKLCFHHVHTESESPYVRGGEKCGGERLHNKVAHAGRLACAPTLIRRSRVDIVATNIPRRPSRLEQQTSRAQERNKKY